MSYTLVLEWMPGDLYMSAVTARCTAPTSSYSVVWLPPNKVYQITLYCGSTSLVSFLVGAFRGKAWSYMSSTTLLSLGNLSVWYTANHPVLSDFSLDLGTNEVVGLIGLNGAGKTTFIKTVAGLLPGYHLDSAVWEGQPFAFRDKAFKRSRYIVFAEDRSFQYFTFREYLAYVAASYDVPLPDVTGLVKGFHFEDYTDVLLKELSTGNLKKAYLITAFALRPKLLLLDEPVNGLDFQSTEFLYQLMGGYKQYGTLLFSSHILESICLTCDRVLVLEHGRISQTFTGAEIAAGNIREVLTDEEHH